MGRVCVGQNTVCASVILGEMDSDGLVCPFFSVLAQVDAKMVKPTPERPLEGIITIHSEISPMASSDYEPGR